MTASLLFLPRNSPEFQKLLGIAMELFLLCSDDSESDVRMVADECLNKVIKVRVYGQCFLRREGTILHVLSFCIAKCLRVSALFTWWCVAWRCPGVHWPACYFCWIRCNCVYPCDWAACLSGTGADGDLSVLSGKMSWQAPISMWVEPWETSRLKRHGDVGWYPPAGSLASSLSPFPAS